MIILAQSKFESDKEMLNKINYHFLVLEKILCYYFKTANFEVNINLRQVAKFIRKQHLQALDS